MDQTTFKNLHVSRVDPGICVLKVSRLAMLNALNTETLSELRQALQAIAEDDSIRVLVFAGDGEKAFIAGADISEMVSKGTPEGVRFAQTGQEVTKLLELMPKPTIAAVSGFALGGGTEMAISCDFIVASESAVFGQPEVGLGIIPGFGATVRLSKFVGLPMAKELIYSGRRIKAPEAREIGLVNHVYSQAEFWPETMKLAELISRQSASAVRKSKQLMNEFSESIGLTAKLEGEAQAFGGLFGSPDQREGMQAFLEKRKPGFQGLS